MFSGGAGGFFETNDNNNNFEEHKGTDQGEPEKKKSKMFVPVTLKMLQEATVGANDTFEIENEPISDVIICGRLLTKDEKPTRTTFDINDNTGTFKVTLYHKEENVPPKCLQNLDYEPDCYVKIFGTARMFKTSRTIVGMHLTKITDFDELTNHFLQVFVASCVRTKGTLKNQDLAAGGAKGKPKTDDEIKELVQNAIKELCKTRPSVGKDAIFTVVKKDITHPELEKGLDALVDDMAVFQGDVGQYSVS